MKKILIIDDNPDFYEPISELLDDEGYTTSVIDDSDVVIEKLATFQDYNLIILDMMLIKGDKIDLGDLPEVGVYIYVKIREKFNMPILVTTALRKEQIWQYFKHDARVEYQSKPVISNYNSFLTLLKKMI